MNEKGTKEEGEGDGDLSRERAAPPLLSCASYTTSFDFTRCAPFGKEARVEEEEEEEEKEEEEQEEQEEEEEEEERARGENGGARGRFPPLSPLDTTATVLSQKPITDSLNKSHLILSQPLASCVLCAKVNKKVEIRKSRLVVFFFWFFFFALSLSLSLSLSLIILFVRVESHRFRPSVLLKKVATPNARPAASAGGPRRPGGRVRLGRLRRDGLRVGPLLDDAGRVAGRPGGAEGLAGGPRTAVSGRGRRRRWGARAARE